MRVEVLIKEAFQRRAVRSILPGIYDPMMEEETMGQTKIATPPAVLRKPRNLSPTPN